MVLSGLFRKKGKDRFNIEHVSVERVFQNPYQPRRVFDKKAMDQLMMSIKENGILVPILVRKVEKGYELACGERRLRACKALGMKTIPAIVRELTTPQMVELALIENLIRADLLPVEEAETYERLKKEFSVRSEKEIAEKFCFSENEVKRYKALTSLPLVLKKALSSSLVTEEQAIELSRIRDENEMFHLLSSVIQGTIDTQQIRDKAAAQAE